MVRNQTGKRDCNDFCKRKITVTRKKNSENIRCSYYSWIVYRRGEKYYADGRGNSPSLGRHSLGADDPDLARKKLLQLDSVMAVRNGLVPRSILDSETITPLSLADGRRLYEVHLARPEVAGGPCAKTRARYRAVFDKFIAFAEAKGIRDWKAATDNLAEQYLRHLESSGYEDATLCLEANFLKQVIKYFVKSKLLPESHLLHLTVKKPSGTSTYCYTREQFEAILEHCSKRTDLVWLHRVVLALGFTGMRISELASLRWADLSVSEGKIVLSNDRLRSTGLSGERRRTKNRTDRILPINPTLAHLFATMSRHASGFVFQGPRGGRLDPDVARTSLIKEVIEPLSARFDSSGDSGFNKARLHSFRHYFCSWAATEGIPERVVQLWLGHRDSSMVARYFHLHEDESKLQIRKLKLTGPQTGDVAREPPAA